MYDFEYGSDGNRKSCFCIRFYDKRQSAYKDIEEFGRFNMISILDYGAVGDGKTLNTRAFEEAIDAARQTRETVLVPGGTFLTGTINLRGVSLYLEAGAVIKGSPDLKD